MCSFLGYEIVERAGELLLTLGKTNASHQIPPTRFGCEVCSIPESLLWWNGSEQISLGRWCFATHEWIPKFNTYGVP